MAKNNKMDWLIKRHLEGKHEFLIHNTGKKFGTVVIPTGGGKSGHIYEDIIWHIQDHLQNRKPGDKIIFNLSAPILKLCAQLNSDLFSALSVIFKNVWEDGGGDDAMFFINSTADGKAFDYLDEMNVNVNRFSTDIDKFLENDNYMFAFVISCHPSLKRFADKIEDLAGRATIYNYIDEGHLIVCKSDGDDIISVARDDKRREKYTRNGNEVDEMTDEEKEEFDSFTKICQYSDSLYLLTATPNKEVCQIVKKRSEEVDGPSNDKNGFIINIKASELIKKGTILPPNPYIRSVDSSDYEAEEGTVTTSLALTPEVCIEFMKRAKADSPDINQKVLVSSGNTDHMEELATGLKKAGYKVFMTSHKTKAQESDGREMVNIDPVRFINEVDNYDGDCFVLHIRQLIQGIDIKSLTSCIIYTAAKVNDGVKRWIIQTVGRTIRPYHNERPENLEERGLTVNDRKKQFGSVFILVGGPVADEVERQVGNLFWRYYGLDGYDAFTRPAGKTQITQKDKGKLSDDGRTPHEVEDFDWDSEDNDEIYKLTVLVSNLINDYFNDHSQTYRIMSRLGMSDDDIVALALPEIKKRASLEYKKICGIVEPDDDLEVEVYNAITDEAWNDMFISNTEDFILEYTKKKFHEVVDENATYQTAI